MDIAIYNANEQEHKNAADTLGGLQRRVDKNEFKQNDHSYYMGLELSKQGVVKMPNTEYRKADAVGSGKGNGRSQNRVIVVKNTLTGKLVEGQAYFWRHDDRIFKMGPGFFERARMYRNM